jgi:tol-pal system protein YbgF
MRSIGPYAIAFVLLAGGCGGSQALRNENARLRLEIAEVKADRRHDKRKIRNLEKRLVVDNVTRALPVEVRAPAAPAPADPGPAAVSTPEGDGEIAYVDDDVEIVYVGEAARDDSVRPTIQLHERQVRDRYRPPPIVSERIPVTRGKVPSIGAAGGAAGLAGRAAGKSDAPTASVETDPRELYKTYYKALLAGNHEFAITGFRNFVASYPKHDYADNAQYWLGEAYYDQRDFKSALAEFRKVADTYSKGNKVADAMLKSAYCYEQLGNRAKARDVLGQIVTNHAKSNAAGLAADRLETLRGDY